MKLNNKGHKDDYDDSGLELIEKPTIYIPYALDAVMDSINRTKDVEDSAEFSVFCKADIQGYDIELKEEYFVPKQRVHSTEVEYDEPRPSPKFNTVIHRHPNGCTNFSSGDNEFINRNFDVSLIWTESGGWVRGQYNLYKKMQRLVLPCDLDRTIINIKGLSKIKKYVEKPTKQYKIEKDDVFDFPKNGKTTVPTFPAWNETDEFDWNAYYNLKYGWGKNDKMSGSSVLDNEGNLVLYDKAIKDDMGTFDNIKLTMPDKVADEVVASMQDYIYQNTKVNKVVAGTRAEIMDAYLDKYASGYDLDSANPATEFHNLMYIVALISLYWGWKEEFYIGFADAMAEKWVAEMYDFVYTRVVNLYNLLKANVIKKTKETTHAS